MAYIILHYILLYSLGYQFHSRHNKSCYQVFEAKLLAGVTFLPLSVYGMDLA